MRKVKKGVIIALVCVAVTLAAVIIGLLLGKSSPKNSSIAVYKNDSAHVIRIKELSVEVEDKSASGFKADKENNRVFYTVDSSYVDNLYDLCYTEVKGSEISEPKIIDYAVKSNFSVVNGKLFYLKYNESQDAFEGYVCDLENKVQTCFDVNIDNIYPLRGIEAFYYTKYHGSTLSLYKYKNGAAEGPLYGNIKTVYNYNDCENPHIIFESSAGHGDSLTDLRILSAEGEELICDSTYFVDYDSYSPGGNLYYYSASENSVSWSYVISDSYVESDKAIVKPNRDDYESEYGVSAEYNEDYIKYQDKLIRDEIRAALNEAVAESGFNAPVYTAFAYNGSGICKVAEDIDPSRVYSVSEQGTPKIIFDNVVLSSADVDMSTLVSISLRNDLDEVISYAWSVLDSNIYSQGIYLAASVQGNSAVYPLESYDKKTTLFSFSEDGARLFAFVKDNNSGATNTVYCNNLGADMSPAKEVSVATGVTDYRLMNGSVIYMKEDVGKNTGDIFSYDGSESVKLSNAASAFTPDGEEYVVIMKNSKSSGNSMTADYYFSHEGEEVLIGENISISSFRCTEDGRAAYVSGENNLLSIYFNGENASVDDNVTAIVLFE